MMNHYDYLIIGGGMTAAAAVEGIRENDRSGSIGLFSNESDPPYNRPPLTKGLWKDKELASIWRKTTDQQVDVRLDCAVTAIDPKEKRVTIGEGKDNSRTYDKLLLATGGNVRRLPFEDDRIIYYRTVADYRRLRTLTETGRKFAVIGGGFIGSEIAAALTMNGK